jgi:hypothetical protein
MSIRVSKIEEMLAQAPVPLSLVCHSPGDGMTRYRFFPRKDEQDYFSGGHICTQLGFKYALDWAEAFVAGMLYYRCMAAAGFGPSREENEASVLFPGAAGFVTIT